MNDKTKRVQSKLGVNSVSMRQTKAAKARGLQRKVEISATRAKPVAMPTRTTKPVGSLPMKPGNIATGSKKTARIMPTGKATKKPSTSKPMTEAQKQKAAMDALMKKRAAETKKTGVYPNYYTN